MTNTESKNLKLKINYEVHVNAPIKKDKKIAKLSLYYEDALLNEYSLYALEDVNRVNIFSRIIRSINFLIWGDV